MDYGLYEKLTEYSREDILPMHMPGHKRNPAFEMENPYRIDVTEVEGMDDLHRPREVIRRLMDKATALYRSDQSYLLVNGSTGGILAAIAACCRHGSTIIMARNCHASVYHAVRLLELRPVYVYPDREGGDMEHLGIAGIIKEEAVEEALQAHPDASCVIVVSPTYEGVVSRIRGIAEVTARYGVPFIVDEAHGAHFNWHSSFPETALSEGADLVVESLHKTLPALTQTGVLHARFARVSKDRLEWCLRTFQSSSPSYVLMSGIDRCFTFLDGQGEEAFAEYIENLRTFYDEMKQLKHVYLFDSSHKESSKLVIATCRTKISGAELAEKLRREYRIETEMSCGNYCIAMTSVCDGSENFRRLAEALKEIDAGLGETDIDVENFGDKFIFSKAALPERVMYSYEAADRRSEMVSLDCAEGRVAAEDIYFYPPGIPLLVQGEAYSPELICLLKESLQKGYRVQGIRDGMAAVLIDCKSL